MRSLTLRPRSLRSGPTSILHLCYLGVAEPLVQTQVIPYLGGLAAAGFNVVLVTFESSPLSGDGRHSFRETLRRLGIEWHTLRYHKWPAIPATFLDIAVGIAYATYLIRTRGINVVHARSHVPAAMALILQWVLGVRFVFDIRGLLADEYVDAGLWWPGGRLYRMVKRMESLFLARADAAVVLTNRVNRWLFGVQRDPIDGRPPVEVIPCCVDLRKFEVNPQRVRRLRDRLGLAGYPIMVYAGKFGGWYMAQETVDFFCVARRHFPGLRFLVLTQSDFGLIAQEFARKDVAAHAYRCLTVLPEEVPEYLALADFAVCFYKQCFSRIACSPTKIGEYLAAGLPVVYNTGIGDLDELEGEEIGVPVTAFHESHYDAAAHQLRVLLEDREKVARRCRAVARERFCLTTVGVPRYLRLYEGLTGRLADHV